MWKQEEAGSDQWLARRKNFALLVGLGLPLVIAWFVAPAFGAAVTAAGTILAVVHTVLSDRS